MKLGGLGERKIIEKLMNLFGTIVEDDSFYFEFGDSFILVTTDIITKKTHIPDNVSPEDAGYFFAALNLSDIAAIGGVPLYFMAAYSISRNFDLDYFLRFNMGIKKCLENYSVKMVGGDTKEGPNFTASGIVIGKTEKNLIMERKNFKPGQVVGITNNLGKNGAGYYLWKNGNNNGAKIMLDIEPRIIEGRELVKLGVRAAMDLSDGVFSSISQIKKQTGTGFKIFLDQIPIHPLAKDVSKNYNIPIEEISLNFGGEYELIFSVPPELWTTVENGMKSRGFSISKIGETWEGENLLISNGKEIMIYEKGYEHFK
ncbi:MAG: thiamine-phosphate kinase [Thermoplasmata archaeon]